MDEREIRLGCLQIAAAMWSRLPHRDGLTFDAMDGVQGWALEMERFVVEMETADVITQRALARQEEHRRRLSEMRNALLHPKERNPTIAEAMRDR